MVVFVAAAPAKRWTVLATCGRGIWPTGYSDVLDDCVEAASIEQRSKIPNGTPILLSENGEVDEWLVLYFTSCPEFTSLDLSSRRTYALEIATWCGFLGEQANPLTWLEATEDDFLDFKARRTDHYQFADAVAGSTWNKAVFALRGLYDWAVGQGPHHMERPCHRQKPSAGRAWCATGAWGPSQCIAGTQGKGSMDRPRNLQTLA